MGGTCRVVCVAEECLCVGNAQISELNLSVEILLKVRYGYYQENRSKNLEISVSNYCEGQL